MVIYRHLHEPSNKNAERQRIYFCKSGVMTILLDVLSKHISRIKLCPSYSLSDYIHNSNLSWLIPHLALDLRFFFSAYSQLAMCEFSSFVVYYILLDYEIKSLKLSFDGKSVKEAFCLELI